MKTVIVLLIFITSSAWSSPCGKEGSIEERIKNCNFSKGEFVLVARSEKGVEIYKDLKTGLLWGDRITTDFNLYGSQKACSDSLPEEELLKDVSWRLPTIKEFEAAAVHGMKDSLPHMFHAFWTSTPLKLRFKSRRKRQAQPAQAFIWDGMEQRSDVGDLKDAASVRCVGKS